MLQNEGAFEDLEIGEKESLPLHKSISEGRKACLDDDLQLHGCLIERITCPERKLQNGNDWWAEVAG